MDTKNKTPKNDFNAAIGNTVLCDGFLIPMTDFVLKSNEWRKQWEIPIEVQERNNQSYRNILNYAKFLKQPLKLEMFVPCDENGNIIPIPKSEDVPDMPPDLQAEYWYSWESDFNKAKEKVLFELNSPVSVETMNYHISRNRNIEYLANFGSIKLTQNSLSAIFG